MTIDRAPPSSHSTASLDGIDTASLQRIVDIDPAALEKIVWAIATAQKQLRSQRSLSGLAAARRRGQKLGRPLAMSEAQIAIARRMMIAGATRKTIARKLEVSRSTLYLALRPYAAEAPPRPKPKGRLPVLTSAQVALARHMLADGVPRKLIAQKLKVSRTTLSIAFKSYAGGPFPQMRRRRAKPSSDSLPARHTEQHE